MVAQQPYIIYTLPNSRTSQAPTGRKIEVVWQNVKAFLENCTTANINEPKNIYIKAYTASEKDGELPEPAQVIIDKTKAIFGYGVTSPIGYLVPGNIPAKQNQIEWRLTKNDLDKAINYVIEGQPYPKYNLGPVELIISYDFRLINPTTKLELPNQQYISYFLISLTENSWIIPSLCFPFTQANQEFFDYIDSITEFIPFKFDPKYLRLGRSNKKGTSNVFSKL